MKEKETPMTTLEELFPISLSRRRLLRQAVATGAGLGALSVGGAGSLRLVGSALAADQPPIGTWPAGSEGPTFNIGAAVPGLGSIRSTSRRGSSRK